MTLETCATSCGAAGLIAVRHEMHFVLAIASEPNAVDRDGCFASRRKAKPGRDISIVDSRGVERAQAQMRRRQVESLAQVPGIHEHCPVSLAVTRVLPEAPV